MEKKEIDDIRKLIQTTTSIKKQAKDIKTSILQDLNEDAENDCKKEYFRMIKKLGKLRARLSKEKTLTADDNGKTIIMRIDEILGSTIPSPTPKILADGKKYSFRDGSEADISSYTNVMNMNIELALINQINKLQILYSEALANIMQLDSEKDLWSRDDGIEEINLIKEENNGRKQPRSEQSSQ